MSEVNDLSDRESRRLGYELRPYLRDDEMRDMLRELEDLQRFEKTGLANLAEQEKKDVKPADIERQLTRLVEEEERRRAAISEKYIGQYRQRYQKVEEYLLGLRVKLAEASDDEDEVRRFTRLIERARVVRDLTDMYGEGSDRAAEALQMYDDAKGKEDDRTDRGNLKAADDLERQLQIDVAEASGKDALAKYLRREL